MKRSDENNSTSDCQEYKRLVAEKQMKNQYTCKGGGTCDRLEQRNDSWEKRGGSEPHIQYDKNYNANQRDSICLYYSLC